MQILLEIYLSMAMVQRISRAFFYDLIKLYD